MSQLDRQAAFLILGLHGDGHSQEEIEDAYYDAVFAVSTYFMRRAFLPILAKKQIRKLEKLQSAAHTFHIRDDGAALDFSFAEADESSLHAVTLSFQADETLLRYQLNRSGRAEDSIRAYEKYMERFSKYANAYVRLFETASGSSELAAGVLKTENMDAGALNAALAAGAYDGVAKREYSRLRSILT